MVHPTNTSIADPTVVRLGWFKGLTLSTHAVRVLHEPLPFAGNGLNGDTAGIGEGCFGVTGQGHDDQTIVNHAQNDRNAFGNGQECDSNGRVGHEQPYQSRHDGSGLIARVEPDSILIIV